MEDSGIGVSARITPPPAWIAAAAAIGLIGGAISLALSHGNANIATLWLPNALLLSIVAIHPQWRAGSIVGAGCVATAIANALFGDSWPTAIAMALANGASIVTNLALLRLLFPAGPTFARPTYILRFAFAALIGGMASALIGAPAVHSANGGDLVGLFIGWASADALSMLLFLPLIVQIADYRAAAPDERPSYRAIVGMTALVLGAAALTFAQVMAPSLFMLAPVLLAATLSLGALGAAISVVASAVIAIPMTIAGLGPVARIYDNWPEQFLFLELYCVVLIFSTAPVAGTLAHIRRISRDLATSQHRYSSLVDNLGEVIFRTDAVGRWLFLNPAWELLTGHSVEASLGRSFLSFVAPEDRAAALAGLALLNDRQIAQARQEVRCPTPDGRLVWCAVTSVLETDDSGAVIGSSGTIRDITEARAQHSALVASEQRFRTLAEYATDIMVRTDQDSLCSYISPAVRSILGYEPDALIGTFLLDLVHPDDRAERQSSRRAILDDPSRDATGRVRMRHSDGSWIWIEAKSRVIDVDPARPRILSVLRDAERNIRLEEALVAARDAAEATARAKNDFVAMISHEIRTPMTGILGMIDLLHDTGSVAERERFFGVLESSSRSLMRILDDVLDIAKLDAGVGRIEASPFDLGALARSATELFRSSAAAKGIPILLDFDDAAPAIVLGDSARLQQVLSNLIGNAVKFTFEGQILLRVAPAGDGQWRFAVHDDGIGIAPNALATIFDPFAQADASTTRRFGGTGLGLTISRRLVEALGGTLSVESVEGVGSIFSFALPLPATTMPVVAPPQWPVSAGPGQPAALSLLVAEDSPINRLLIATLLKRLGHRVLSVDDGRAAVIAARQGGYDAILMDVQMPIMDGIDAALAIRSLPGANGTVPIIAVTADPLAERSGRFAAAGFAAVIGKPIERSALEDALAMLSPGRTERPVVDHVALAEMRTHLGVDATDRLLNLFVVDGTARAASLSAALAANDLVAMRAQAHAIAGGASAACARRLEAAARQAMRPGATIDDGEALAAALAAAITLVGTLVADPHPAEALALGLH